MSKRKNHTRGPAADGILIWRPPTLLRVVNGVCRVVGGWSDEDLTRPGRLAALARALDCPCPAEDGGRHRMRLQMHVGEAVEELDAEVEIRSFGALVLVPVRYEPCKWQPRWVCSKTGAQPVSSASSR